ncbi:MAG TPA: hypothetical protein VGQ57_06940 [Polyangiaceae bacterium]|nr:hypothetical protein [Polyangiaceae bacterium]
MRSEPANGAGLDCDPEADDCGVPTDTAVTLWFDRFLLPSSAVRQSVAIYTGLPTNPALPTTNLRAELSPRYDLTDRSVRYVFPAGFTLQPKTLYTIVLPIYTEQSPSGFQAFDGAALDGEQAVRLAFFTGREPSGSPVAVPSAPSCDDVQRALDGCTACHGALGADPAPPMGLSLTAWDGLEATAIGRPAHQTEIGDTTGLTSEAPPRFGVNMPVIDPERPDNSYLMYKLLLRPEAYQPSPNDPSDCSSDGECSAPDPAELARLHEWFVRGDPMPAVSPGESFVFHRELTTIQAFIGTGAACP